MKTKTLALPLPLFASSTSTAPLQLDVCDLQNKAILPIPSTLVFGLREAVLFNAQFGTKDGEQLIQIIHASGKTLEAIVITPDDPDFYFGLQPIVEAFPQVKVLATPQVVDHIRVTREAEPQFWGPQMKDGAPTSLTVPQATTQTQFTVDGKALGLCHANDHAAYIWTSANRAIIGGTGVASDVHVWTVDTQSEQQRSVWRNVLSKIQSLQPTQVIPGRYIGERPTGNKTTRFTQDYLQSFEQALGAKKGSDYVIKTMTAAWSGLADVSSLELGAKVNSGETKWQ